MTNYLEYSRNTSGLILTDKQTTRNCTVHHFLGFLHFKSLISAKVKSLKIYFYQSYNSH